MRRGLAIWAFAAACLIMPACSHTPYDPVSEQSGPFQSSAYRADHAPYGTLAIRQFLDFRSAKERGRVNYLNESYYSESLFRRSVPSTLRHLIQKEIHQSGAFTILKDSAASKYTMDIKIQNFYARADRSLIGLIPVVPDVDLDLRVRFHVLLRDQDGRRFLDRVYDQSEHQKTATIAGIEASAAEELSKILSTLMADLVVDCDQAIPEFWKQYNLPVQ